MRRPTTTPSRPAVPPVPLLPGTPWSAPAPSGTALADTALLVAARDSVRLQELAESISTGIMEFDVARGGCVWVNQAYLDLVGRELHEVLGSGWLQTVHPDDLEALQEARSRPGRTRFRVRHVLPAGGVRHVDVTLVPLEVDEAAGGVRVRSVVSVHDVTEAVEQAGRDLRQERRFRRLFDSAAVGMAVCAVDGLVLDVNPAYCALLHIDAGDLVGRRVHDVVLSQDGPFRWDGAVAALQAGLALPLGEQHVRRPDGTSFWAQASMALGVGDDGDEVVIAQLLDVDEQHHQRLELALRADHDELTGLANRAAVLAAVSRGLLGRSGFLAVLFCDLDRFKNVNDSLGHATGDEVLRAVARRLQATVRSSDLVGRLGGDEFVVLLHDVEDPSHAQVTAARVGAALAVPVEVGGQQLTCGVSVGITVVDLAERPDGLDADTLLRDADTEMYDAKGAGRGTFRVFTDEMRDRAVQRLAVENDLRRAVEGGELVVHYQPVVDLADGRRTGFEALVRWQHPQRGLLLPGEFLDVAQESGLAGALDDAVLEDALGFLARHPDVRVSVNTSPRRFDGTFAARVAEGLARHGVPGDRLAVELLETSLLDASPATADELAALAALGCPVLIDDFGTGYSALAYLRRLPVTGLKLDRSFVADLPGDGDADRIASAVVGLSQGFGLLSVAEGVETAEQAEHLRRQGWDCAQGWFFGRPAAESHWYG